MAFLLFWGASLPNHEWPHFETGQLSMNKSETISKNLWGQQKRFRACCNFVTPFENLLPGHCVVLCGMAWYRMVLWYGLVLHGIVWYCMALCGIVTLSHLLKLCYQPGPNLGDRMHGTLQRGSSATIHKQWRNPTSLCRIILQLKIISRIVSSPKESTWQTMVGAMH